MNKGGIVLIVLGAGILIWGAIGFKTRETVVDIGPIHATRDVEHNVPYAPILGGLVLVGGVILLVTGKR